MLLINAYEYLLKNKNIDITNNDLFKISYTNDPFNKLISTSTNNTENNKIDNNFLYDKSYQYIINYIINYIIEKINKNNHNDIELIVLYLYYKKLQKQL